MYDFRSKKLNAQKNSTKYISLKTEFFQKETKKLLANGIHRKFARKIIKSAINKIGEIGPSKFAHNNLRKTRKERAKRLKVPFNPLYNGPVYKSQWIRDENTNKLTKQFVLISGE